MPFTRAGFNARHRRTGIVGWTAAVRGSRFEPAQLIRFQCGDFAWLGVAERFLAWGEQVRLRTHLAFNNLPFACLYGPQSRLP